MLTSESDENNPTKREGERKEVIAAVLLGVLLGSPCESTDGLATTPFYSERRSSDEFGGESILGARRCPRRGQ